MLFVESLVLVGISLNEWLVLLEARHPRTIDLGLERSCEVWGRMGSPRPARQIFTVAGTNGKGSTVAYLCGMLKGLGYSFGSYTTPHLFRYNERVRVNGIAASDRLLLDAFERVEAARGDVSLSYFEFGTLAAISLMHDYRNAAGNEVGLDFAVMEVGLGGRLDAVNILDANCAVITTVGLDHQEYLGDDRESIGREKAGIIRRNVPLICGEKDPPASVLAEASRLQAPLLRLGHEFSAVDERESIRFTRGATDILLPRPQMIGRHQVDNMATALAALLELAPHALNNADQLVGGLALVSLAGRLQRVSDHPPVYVDVGHNAQAAEAIREALSKMMGQGEISSCHCVLAMLADKDATAVAQILEPVVSAWYCAGLGGERGQSGEQLANKIRAGEIDAKVTSCVDVGTALDAALSALSTERPGADCVLVFGSFLSAGQAIGRWHADQSADRT
ncbi:MAG: folylpolyglutamate synthase/dihydrofolate synthase family protein [Xanthomonadales bacterium]